MQPEHPLPGSTAQNPKEPRPRRSSTDDYATTAPYEAPLASTSLSRTFARLRLRLLTSASCRKTAASACGLRSGKDALSRSESWEEYWVRIAPGQIARK